MCSTLYFSPRSSMSLTASARGSSKTENLRFSLTIFFISASIAGKSFSEIFWPSGRSTS